MICEWVKEVATIPVLAKLTPNVTNVKEVGRACKQGGADGISLINTINSIMGVDVNTFTPRPNVGGFGSHGGYCGPAVKPIALHMVSEIATDPQIALPISGIGGIRKWEDCAEFLLLGCNEFTSLHRGHASWIWHRQRDDQRLTKWMETKGFSTLEEAIGLATPESNRGVNSI